MAVILSKTTNGNLFVLTLKSSPLDGGGTPAPQGSTAMVIDGSEWIKFGPLDTDWRDFSDEEFNSVTFLNQTNEDPPESGVKIFAENDVLKTINDSGLANIIQLSLGQKKIFWWDARGNDNTVNIIGGIVSSTGTGQNRTIATTNFFTAIKKYSYRSGNAAGNSCGLSGNNGLFFLSNINFAGGFTYISRFGIGDAAAVAQGRMFVGLYSQTSIIGNVNPSTLQNLIGVGSDSGDANLSIIHNDASGTANKISLGANFPANTRQTDFFELMMVAQPNSSIVYYNVRNLRTGNKVSGSINSNLPASNLLLAIQAWRNNGTTGSAVAIDISSIYVETNY